MNTKQKKAKLKLDDLVSITNPDFAIEIVDFSQINRDVLSSFTNCKSTQVLGDEKGNLFLKTKVPDIGLVGRVRAIDHKIYQEDKDLGDVDVYTYAISMNDTTYFVLEHGLQLLELLIHKN